MNDALGPPIQRSEPRCFAIHERRASRGSGIIRRGADERRAGGSATNSKPNFPSRPQNGRREGSRLSVSNSLSGGDRELDEVPAVGDPAHVAEIGKGLRVSTDERRRCVSLQ